MKPYFVILGVLLTGFLHGQKVVNYDPIMPLEPYNFVLGTNAIGGKYQFTTDSKLLEQAKQVRSMGSNIIKISIGANAIKAYGLNISKEPTTTLEQFLAHPDYKKVFDMDFKYLFAWVHTITGINWKKGLNAEQEKAIYDEMYEFATYLLETYDNSGKTFMIGNWEGDWLLHPNYNRTFTPPQQDLDAMTKWFQIRQKAIDDAKKASAAKNVQLYHYIEVNLVLKGMRGEPCISSSILSKVNVDLVSYSSYEAIKNRTAAEKKEQLSNIFNYLEKQLQPKAGLPFSRRVFIGEYGYHANINDTASFNKQYNETKDIMRIAFELDLPFALHWQMYNNEYEANGESKQMSLINEQGEKMPLYDLHQRFYREMNDYLQAFKKNHNDKAPSSGEFRKRALELLSAENNTN